MTSEIIGTPKQNVEDAISDDALQIMGEFSSELERTYNNNLKKLRNLKLPAGVAASVLEGSLFGTLMSHFSFWKTKEKEIEFFSKLIVERSKELNEAAKSPKVVT